MYSEGSSSLLRRLTLYPCPALRMKMMMMKIMKMMMGMGMITDG